MNNANWTLQDSQTLLEMTVGMTKIKTDYEQAKLALEVEWMGNKSKLQRQLMTEKADDYAQAIKDLEKTIQVNFFTPNL